MSTPERTGRRERRERGAIHGTGRPSPRPRLFNNLFREANGCWPLPGDRVEYGGWTWECASARDSTSLRSQRVCTTWKWLPPEGPTSSPAPSTQLELPLEDECLDF